MLNINFFKFPIEIIIPLLPKQLVHTQNLYVANTFVSKGIRQGYSQHAILLNNVMDKIIKKVKYLKE